MNLLPTFDNEFGTRTSLDMSQFPDPYLATLIDPKNHIYRYPDDYNRPTATYQSYEYVDVVGNSAAATAASDKGKFAFSIRPNVGRATSVSWHICWVEPTSNWSSPTFDKVNDSNLDTLCGAPAVYGTGLVRELRPVSMSVWFKHTAPFLNSGGNVAACLVDGSQSSYFRSPVATPLPAPGRLAEYKNLAKCPGAFEGAIINGTYSYYSPYDFEDSNFKNLTESFGADYYFPSIMVAGQSTLIAGEVVGRIEVIVNYEYVTTSRIPNTLPSPVHPEYITFAKQVLASLPSSISNEEHLSWIQRVLESVREWVMKNARPVGREIGTLLGGKEGGKLGQRLGGGVAKLTKEVIPKQKPLKTSKTSKPKMKKK